MIERGKVSFAVSFYSSLSPVIGKGFLRISDIVLIIPEKANKNKEYLKVFSRLGIGYIWNQAIEEF